MPDKIKYEDPYSKEIPKAKEFKNALDTWLTGNVVEPMAGAGYPNLGAGVATVPSTIAEFLVPEQYGEMLPGMAGVGKISRKGFRAEKDLMKLKGTEEGRKAIADKIDQLTRWIEDKTISKSPEEQSKATQALDSLYNIFFSELTYEKAIWPYYAGVLKRAKKGPGEDFERVGRINEYKKKVGNELLAGHEAMFGKPDFHYVPPKRLEAQKLAKEQKLMPKEPELPKQSYSDYENMLKGKPINQSYFYEPETLEEPLRQSNIYTIEEFLKGKK